MPPPTTHDTVYTHSLY